MTCLQSHSIKLIAEIWGVGWGPRKGHSLVLSPKEALKYRNTGREDGHSMTTTDVNRESREFKGTMSYANLTRLLSDPTHR